ncbi:MAG: hypothetical protein ABJI00_12255 [Paracoccaceae bacterium]
MTTLIVDVQEQLYREYKWGSGFGMLKIPVIQTILKVKGAIPTVAHAERPEAHHGVDYLFGLSNPTLEAIEFALAHHPSGGICTNTH